MPRTVCSKCGLPLDGSSPTYCKACMAAYMRQRYAERQDVREYQKAEQKKNYDKNREEIRRKAKEKYDADPDSHNQYRREWREARPDLVKNYKRKSNLKRLYGLSIEQFEEMLLDQDKRCGICGVEMTMSGRGGTNVNIDHDHATGQVRGLLCSHCNNGLGCFKDSIDRLEVAIAYLSYYSSSIEEMDATLGGQ